jgi:hypothetical protein
MAYFRAVGQGDGLSEADGAGGLPLLESLAENNAQFLLE